MKIQFPYRDQHVNKSLDFNYCLSAALKDREQRFSRPALSPQQDFFENFVSLFLSLFLSFILGPVSSFTLLLFLPLLLFFLLFIEMDCTKHT